MNNDAQAYADYAKAVNDQSQKLCTLRGLFEFVGVDSDVDLASYPIRSQPLRGPRFPMPPAVKSLLTELLDRHMTELEDLLGWGLSGWRSKN